MKTELNLSPLFRKSIGFDRFNTMFESALQNSDSANQYPHYDIEKMADNAYRISLAIAGFTESDVVITVKGNELRIVGKIADKSDIKHEYIHKGIANRAFDKRFSLADNVEVMSADIKNGLLIIDLERQVPEQEQLRTIEIGGASEESQPH